MTDVFASHCGVNFSGCKSQTLGQEELKNYQQIAGRTLNSVPIALAISSDWMDLGRIGCRLLHRSIFSRERGCRRLSLSGINRWSGIVQEKLTWKDTSAMKQAAITLLLGQESLGCLRLYTSQASSGRCDVSVAKAELLVVLDK